MKSTGRLWLLAVCLLCGLVCTQAQEQEKKQLPREVPSPEKAARKMTDRMKEELQLTDKQYDKLYKLNLKEQQEHFATMTERGNGQRPSMGGRPGMGGGRPPMEGGMGPGMGGGRPPMGAPGERPAMEKDNVEKMQKAAAKKEEDQENPDDRAIRQMAGNASATRTTSPTGSSSQTKSVETLSK